MSEEKSLTTQSLFPELFSDFFRPWNDWLGPSLFSNGGSALANAVSHIPAVNIKKSKDRFELEVAAPGMEKSDFQVDVEGGRLSISAEKKSEKKEEDKEYSRREYNYSSFRRSFTLPDSVDGSKIEAKYDNGVLKIHLPIKPEAQKAESGVKIAVK